MSQTPRRGSSDTQKPAEKAELAVRGSADLVPGKPLTTMAAWNEYAALTRARSDVNLIAPITAVDHIPAMSQLAVNMVEIDSYVDDKGSGPDCYYDRRFCGQGEVAFGKRALLKIMQGAGLSKTDSYRSDDRADPNYCEWTVVLTGRALDGSIRRTMRSKEIDFRDGRPETMKPEWVKEGNQNRKTGKTIRMEDDVLGEKRKNIQALAETKALTAAVRELMVLPHKMATKAIDKPFLIPCLVPHLDESDPDVKRALIQERIHGSAALYSRPGVEARRAPSAAPPIETSVRHADEAAAVVEQAPERPQEPRKQAEAQAPRTEAVIQEEPAEEPPADDPAPPPALEPSAPVCSCACSCQAEITKVQEKRSVGAVKAPRCVACYPGPDFDFKKHKDHDGPLGLPDYPKADVAQVKKWNVGRAKK